MSFQISYPTMSAIAATYKQYSEHEVLLKDASLVSLIDAIGSLCASLSTTDKTSPPQAEYNKIVVAGLEKIGFFSIFEHLLKFGCYDDADFANFTVVTRIGSFPRPTKEEFQEFKHMYVLHSNLDLKLSEVFPIELIRALRLCASNLIFRFFRTYDVDEVRVLKDGKKVNVCDPSRATYRVDGTQRSSAQFTTFLTDLIGLYRFISQFSYELTEFVEPFKTAAMTAKKMREEFKKAQAQAHAQAKKSDKYDKSASASAEPKRTATLSKAFVKTVKAVGPVVELPPPPKNNAWADRRVKIAAVAETQATAQATDESSDEDEPTKEVQADQGEFKVVVSKSPKHQRGGNRFTKDTKQTSKPTSKQATKRPQQATKRPQEAFA
jgi:hypothetical protein